MNYSLLIFSIFLSLSIACKSDSKEERNKSKQRQTESSHTKPTEKQLDLRYVKPDELKGKELSKWTFLTRGYFQKAVQIKSGEVMVDQVQGQWMKLLDDYRYQFGKGDSITEFGIWTYDKDRELIHFDNKADRGANSEWKIAPGNDILIFVGTSKYNNNGTQVKWERVVE